jgi:hypothetical protein
MEIGMVGGAIGALASVSGYTIFTPADRITLKGIVVSASLGFGIGFVAAVGGAYALNALLYPGGTAGVGGGAGGTLAAEAAVGVGTVETISGWVGGSKMVIEVATSVVVKFDSVKQLFASYGVLRNYWLQQAGKLVRHPEYYLRFLIGVVDNGKHYARAPESGTAIIRYAWRVVRLPHGDNWLMVKVGQAGQIVQTQIVRYATLADDFVEASY